jgi:KDO2-lipid IV(A) lauroyltransferase
VKATRGLEALLVRMLFARMRAGSWAGSLSLGARLGALAHHLGVRRRVAEENLALAFPERSAAARAGILAEHYRELGRVAAEYSRLDTLAAAAPGEVIAEIRGAEHYDRALAGGRGALVMTGHFGNFELMAAMAARRWPLDVVVQPLSNPGVEAMIARIRAAAGISVISAATGLRRVLAALRAGRLVAIVADQDARRHGVFVPFLGRPASTPVGPARLALATGAPILTGFIHRRPDGRHEIEFEGPVPFPDAADPDPVTTLTVRHTERVERRIRERPEHWFWLHRRWKTPPPAELRPAVGHGHAATIAAAPEG